MRKEMYHLHSRYTCAGQLPCTRGVTLFLPPCSAGTSCTLVLTVDEYWSRKAAGKGGMSLFSETLRFLAGGVDGSSLSEDDEYPTSAAICAVGIGLLRQSIVHAVSQSGSISASLTLSGADVVRQGPPREIGRRRWACGRLLVRSPNFTAALSLAAPLGL